MSSSTTAQPQPVATGQNDILKARREDVERTVTDKRLRAIMAKGQPHPPISDETLRGLEFRFSNRGKPSGSVKGRLRGSALPPIRCQPANIRSGRWLKFVTAAGCYCAI